MGQQSGPKRCQLAAVLLLGTTMVVRFGRRFWTAALQRLQQRFVTGPADWSTPQ